MTTREHRFKDGQAVRYYPIHGPSVNATVLRYSHTGKRVKIEVETPAGARRWIAYVNQTSLSDING